jgi:hypothetical protein
MSQVEMIDSETMINPHCLVECSLIFGDRVPDHVGGPQNRKSVSRIDTAISGNAGPPNKNCCRSGNSLARRLTR